MLIIVVGLLLAFSPFLLFMGPFLVWAAWPSIALLTAVFVARAIQRRRHSPALIHQH